MNDRSAQGKHTVAFGCACFDSEQDKQTHIVLERADAEMYSKKKELVLCQDFGQNKVRNFRVS